MTVSAMVIVGVFLLALFGKAFLDGWRTWQSFKVTEYHERKLAEGERRLQALRDHHDNMDPFADWDEEFEEATGKDPYHHLPPPEPK